SSCYLIFYISNVKEWCLNEIAAGYATAGGSWEDPVYLFADYGIYSGFYASSSLGFRCVRNSPNAKGNQGAMKLNLDERTPTYHPVDEETFKRFLSLYKYDRIPPDVEVVETRETPDWTRLKITFRGVHDDRVIAYMYLPKRAKKPFQCINFIPHSGVFYGVNIAETTEYIFAPHIKTGRAVLAVVPKGAVEREWGSNYLEPEINTVRYREETVKYATEFSLGLDYLATRDDIDMGKLAYVGVSWGAHCALMSAAVEIRYRTVVFIGGGLEKSDEQKLPGANPINFLPYIKPPKLLLNGKYDETFPFETHARPFYNLMREPKKLALVEGGHTPPLEQRVPVLNQWLDETLGPVKFE
ncbi:MAG: alpha/beta hydrolase family protein, partial [bacterium]